MTRAVLPAHPHPSKHGKRHFKGPIRERRVTRRGSSLLRLSLFGGRRTALISKID